jgi:hypothetical protein
MEHLAKYMYIRFREHLAEQRLIHGTCTWWKIGGFSERGNTGMVEYRWIQGTLDGI